MSLTFIQTLLPIRISVMVLYLGINGYSADGEGTLFKPESPAEFLELFALCAGIFTWSEHLAGTRIVVFCDNISVVYMVNNLTSSCIQCMKLIRFLTLDNLKNDRRVFVRHVWGKNNQLSDALSRQDLNRFFRLAPSTMNLFPDKVSNQLWPLSKILDTPTIL